MKAPKHPQSDEAFVEIGRWLERAALGGEVPPSLLELAAAEPQKAFPAIAKDVDACNRLSAAVSALPTGHVLHNLDSRHVELKPESVDLIVTSPPYWTLKKYNDGDGQLGDVEGYDDFLDQLDEVWRRAYNALVPGGRVVIVVGDVNVSRKAFGRHMGGMPPSTKTRTSSA